ncbi:Integrase catalytic core protein [Phytophthora palmivora]|uniref:Integrase catalytic core protein n=1 Tax=Phytophthora palmivora TaxID=4796 RepID=A0A2P4XEQ3_9STRA|nr:Integrase catalytic core protein [Phytophthora palmivora]
MMSQAGLPKSFWVHALENAVYVKNRVFCKGFVSDVKVNEGIKYKDRYNNGFTVKVEKWLQTFQEFLDDGDIDGLSNDFSDDDSQLAECDAESERSHIESDIVMESADMESGPHILQNTALPGYDDASVKTEGGSSGSCNNQDAEIEGIAKQDADIVTDSENEIDDDENTAYLNAVLTIKPYLDGIEGYLCEQKGHIYVVNKALYGLKQSGREWNTEFNRWLKDYGFERNSTEPCLYVYNHNGKFALVMIYVDDILCATKNEAFKIEMFGKLDRNYGPKGQGLLNKYLGAEQNSDGDEYSFYIKHHN